MKNCIQVYANNLQIKRKRWTMHKTENRRNKDSNKYEHGKKIIEFERRLLRGILC